MWSVDKTIGWSGDTDGNFKIIRKKEARVIFLYLQVSNE